MTADTHLNRRSGQWALLVATCLALPLGLLVHWAAGVIAGTIFGTLTGIYIEKREMDKLKGRNFEEALLKEARSEHNTLLDPRGGDLRGGIKQDVTITGTHGPLMIHSSVDRSRAALQAWPGERAEAPQGIEQNKLSIADDSTLLKNQHGNSNDLAVANADQSQSQAQQALALADGGDFEDNDVGKTLALAQPGAERGTTLQELPGFLSPTSVSDSPGSPELMREAALRAMQEDMAQKALARSQKKKYGFQSPAARVIPPNGPRAHTNRSGNQAVPSGGAQTPSMSAAQTPGRSARSQTQPSIVKVATVTAAGK